MPYPDAEIAQVHRSGRQPDLSDTDADKLPPEQGPDPRAPPLGHGDIAMTALLVPAEPLVVAAGASRQRLTAVCSHELGGLPCVNRAPHTGKGRGCVHHSESGVPDRHDYGDEE